MISAVRMELPKSALKASSKALSTCHGGLQLQVTQTEWPSRAREVPSMNLTSLEAGVS